MSRACPSWSEVTNTAARAFYEKYGFRKLRIVRGYYEDGEDGMLMSKDLR